MKICFMCDLHLPFEKKALQYDVLEWAIQDIIKTEPDCIIFAGDVTCDGNMAVYNEFTDKMNSLSIPYIYIPGNSDLRCPDSAEAISKKASACKNTILNTQVFALNDCDGNIREEDYIALQAADENAVVFMHHPLPLYDARMQKWCKEHKSVTVFFGHMHKSFQEDNLVSLQAMDPDKAIGECPCITYYDTDTKKLQKSHYLCPVPCDIYEQFGISCYDAKRDIEFAIHNKLKYLELRASLTDENKESVKHLVQQWRQAGGENLSLHFPDIEYKDGKVIMHKRIDDFVETANCLRIDRITQHVPKISVREARMDESALEKICDALAQKISTIDHSVVVGVENMHMTKQDNADDTRRFGYLPEECIEFMNILQSRCDCRVGINFDIGHARNNMPYSQKYQISTWLSMVGKYIVGYHIHQVTENNGVFENHVAISDIYGRLISYASLFKNWTLGNISKAPVVFEMRPEGAYETTLKTFEAYRKLC